MFRASLGVPAGTLKAATGGREGGPPVPPGAPLDPPFRPDPPHGPGDPRTTWDPPAVSRPGQSPPAARGSTGAKEGPISDMLTTPGPGRTTDRVAPTWGSTRSAAARCGQGSIDDILIGPPLALVPPPPNRAPANTSAGTQGNNGQEPLTAFCFAPPGPDARQTESPQHGVGQGPPPPAAVREPRGENPVAGPVRSPPIRPEPQC